MKDFHVYSPTEIISVNLREIAERFNALCEQEWAHLRELATEIVVAAPSLQELLSSLPDNRPSAAFDRSSNGLTDARARAHATEQSVLLCKAIAQLIAEKEPFPLDMFFFDTQALAFGASHRIIYQKSSYTDEAYLVLSSPLSAPQASYAHTFHASCEAVYNGTCEFCILPVENAVEGQLGTFSRLITQYELKIAATCEVSGGGDTRRTRFALLRKTLLPIIDVPRVPYFFECTLPHGSSPELSDILDAARLCNVRLHRITSLPRASSDGQLATHLVFSADGADLRAFLCYLAMEAPHYTPIGFYPHLIQKGI